MSNFIYATYSVVDMLDDLYDDEGNLNKDQLLGLNYDLKLAQEFAKNLLGYNRVYAFIANEAGSVLDPHYGLDVTDADNVPKMYSDAMLADLKATLPLSPNQPDYYAAAPSYLLPIFGFCAGRAVHIRRDRTGHVSRPQPTT